MRNNKITIMICFVAVLLFSGCTIEKKSKPSAGSKEYTFNSNIQISLEGGKEWKASNKSINKPTTTDPDILSMAVNPQDGETVYIGLRKGGLMRTTNGGETWEFMNLPTEQISAIVFDSTKPKTFFVSTVAGKRGKILKSDDGGENWFELYTFAIDGPTVMALAIDKRNPKIIYATTSDRQAIKSIDGGETWKNIYQSNAPISEIAIDAEKSNLIYFMEKGGQVLRSNNSGESFELLSEQLSDSKLQSSGFEVLRTDPNRSGWVYLAGNNGIVRSRDAGNSWENVVILSDSRGAPVSALAINPIDSKEIIYGAVLATFKSNDEGKTWSTSQFDLKKRISALEYSSTDPKKVYAGFSGK